MKNNISNFPQLAEWIKERCANHQEPFVRDSAAMIKYCFDLDINIPTEYGWRRSDVENIKYQVEKATTPGIINKIFWLDQLKNIEAYSIISFWRGVELVKSAIRCLNVKEIISSAVLTRSAIELSCLYLTNANIIDKNLGQLQFPSNTVVVSEELEKLILKMMWATRLNDPEPHLKQINILTIIQKLAKNPNAKNILPLYEYLCEIAHPNKIGNIRFWSHVEQMYSDGSQQVIISRFAQSDITEEILDKTLYGLSWSSAVLRNSFEIISASTQQFLVKLPREIEK